ncbi:MAG: hypothetical protein Kow0025_15970 [Thermodesulfovibrionales bacterium]
MKILHILVDGPTDLSSRIIEAQAKEHQTKVIDLSKKQASYEAIIDEIASSDRVISW